MNDDPAAIAAGEGRRALDGLLTGMGAEARAPREAAAVGRGTYVTPQLRSLSRLRLDVCQMKFLVSWTLPPATFQPAVARFLEGGGMPPAGVKLIGRWHGMSGAGCAVVETDDDKALYDWIAEWSEFLPMQTTPVLEDAEAGEVLSARYK